MEQRDPACNVGCNVLTAWINKSSIFWDIEPRSLFKVDCRFEEHVASIFRVKV
jgi:hypothetical protein